MKHCAIPISPIASAASRGGTRSFEAGVDHELKLPHRAFHRSIGEFSRTNVSPSGEIISDDEWQRRESEWLPSKDDMRFVASLMKAETRPGKFAGWIAAPTRGINLQPI